MKKFPAPTISPPGVRGVDWEVGIDFFEPLGSVPSVDRIIETITRAIDFKVDA